MVAKPATDYGDGNAACYEPDGYRMSNLCGEISLVVRAGAVFVAEATYCASLNRTPDAPSG
jgi:hypothetical protein